jgi:hypothetical protein
MHIPLETSENMLTAIVSAELSRKSVAQEQSQTTEDLVTLAALAEATSVTTSQNGE